MRTAVRHPLGLHVRLTLDGLAALGALPAGGDRRGRVCVRRRLSAAALEHQGQPAAQPGGRMMILDP